MSQNYIKSFNALAETYINKNSSLNSSKLNKCLTLLRSTATSEMFVPQSLEVCVFFTNLLNLVQKINEESGSTSLLDLSLDIFEIAIQDTSVQEGLVTNYAIIPVLADVFHQVRDSSEDRTIRLLRLVQNCTYGLRIKWEEPYLEALIKQLVTHIMDEAASKELARLSLSVLVNLCYRNPQAAFVISRITSTSKLGERLQSIGLALASKMYIVMQDTMSEKDVHTFLQLSFKEMEIPMGTWNAAQFRHIVSFVLDLAETESTREVLAAYKHFPGDVTRLLELIDDRMDDNNSVGSGQQKCMSFIFELLTCLVSVDPSLNTLYESIAKLADSWLLCPIAGRQATHLIAEIFTKCDENLSFQSTYESLRELCAAIQSDESIAPNRMTALLRLIAMATTNAATIQVLSKIVTKSMFDKLLGKLWTMDTKSDYHAISEDEMALYLYGLNALIELSKVSTKDWWVTVARLLELPVMHHVLARGLHSDNEEIRTLVLSLSKMAEFPSENISKVLGKLMATKGQKMTTVDTPTPIIINRPSLMTNEMSERLEATLSIINDAVNLNQLNQFSHELIELYNFKLQTYKQTEEQHLHSLQMAHVEITNLTRRIAFLKSAVEKHDHLMQPLLANAKQMELENASLKRERNTFQQSMVEFQQKLNNKSMQHAKCGSIIVAKTNEIERLLDNERLLASKLEKTKADAIEMNKRNEEFRKAFKCQEDGIKQTEKLVEEKTAEINGLNRKIYDMGKELSKLADDLVQKDGKIMQYENELKESQSIQNAILSMVQSKKGKK